VPNLRNCVQFELPARRSCAMSSLHPSTQHLAIFRSESLTDTDVVPCQALRLRGDVGRWRLFCEIE
jgi:hypothetical protein